MVEFKERRKYFRIKLITKVAMVQEDRFHYFYSRDLSVGGIFLETDQPYPAGSNLELEIPLPEITDKVHLKGKVVRVVPIEERQKGNVPGMGIQFVELDSWTKAMLADFIAREMAHN